jgi:branched-chain amino acid transport system ATP-binding protein
LQYKRFPRLEERRGQKTRLLSGGEQQIAAIARALMARPQLLLLDEPSLGLSPRWIDQITRIVRSFRSEGRTVLLVEQNAHEALELADRGYVIETGRIVRGDSSAGLLSDEALADAYLGGIGHALGEMEARIRAHKQRLASAFQP